MATAKQLAALKKARAARKKNLANSKKKSVTSRVKAKRKPVKRKTRAKSVPIKKRKKATPKRRVNPFYVVALRADKKTVYYKWPNIYDTNVKKALKYKKAEDAENRARCLFKTLKNLPGFEWVKVEKK